MIYELGARRLASNGALDYACICKGVWLGLVGLFLYWYGAAAQTRHAAPFLAEMI
jgi:hypothetical protein